MFSLERTSSGGVVYTAVAGVPVRPAPVQLGPIPKKPVQSGALGLHEWHGRHARVIDRMISALVRDLTTMCVTSAGDAIAWDRERLRESLLRFAYRTSDTHRGAHLLK